LPAVRIEKLVPVSADSPTPNRSSSARRAAIVVAFLMPAILLPAAVVLLVAGLGGANHQRVAYAQVQSLFTQSCAGCHPGVNPSLDLSPGHSYASLINQRALEDPRYLRVAVGDPEKSFLYLKVAGFAPQAEVGGRMPFGRPPLSAAQIAVLRDWIMQGARGPNGKLPPQKYPTPTEQPLPQLPLAEHPTGTGTITGQVKDQERKPIKGALVTLLLRGPSQPGGEEHYRVAVTNSAGRYTLPHAPSGTFELKAYAPKRIYVSHFVALRPGGTSTVDFGLPNRALTTPTISNPKVRLDGGSETLSMTVQGPNLDPNYTLAVNPASGRLFELHSPGNRPGTWSRTIPDHLTGQWIFVAIDRICSVSSFITVRS
jgi:mono/diheme cytochrome c family protein